MANVGACGASGCHAYSRGCALGFALAFLKVGEEADGGWCCEKRQDGLTCCGSGSRHLVPVMTMSTYCAWGQRSRARGSSGGGLTGLFQSLGVCQVVQHQVKPMLPIVDRDIRRQWPQGPLHS